MIVKYIGKIPNLTRAQIAGCVQGTPAYQPTKWDHAIADAASLAAMNGPEVVALVKVLNAVRRFPVSLLTLGLSDQVEAALGNWEVIDD